MGKDELADTKINVFNIKFFIEGGMGIPLHYNVKPTAKLPPLSVPFLKKYQTSIFHQV